MYALSFRIESERQQHRLAEKYYGHWHFWMLFLPATVLTMASSILSFLGGSLSGVKKEFALIVGALATVSTFLQTLTNHLGYGTYGAMHGAAALDLKEISDALKFDILQNRYVPEIYDSRNPTVKKYHKLYEQVMKGTKSAIPLKISQAFELLETRIDGIAIVKGRETIANLPSQEVIQRYFACTARLYVNITKHRWWPFDSPHAEYVVHQSLEDMVPFDNLIRLAEVQTEEVGV
jgi:hypothetical protein